MCMIDRYRGCVLGSASGAYRATSRCSRDTYICHLPPHVSTPTPMALARHRDYRTTRRCVQVDGDHLRAAVGRLTEHGCQPDATLIDSLLDSVKNDREEA
jgi:hypothetical protein